MADCCHCLVMDIANLVKFGNANYDPWMNDRHPLGTFKHTTAKVLDTQFIKPCIIPNMLFVYHSLLLFVSPKVPTPTGYIKRMLSPILHHTSSLSSTYQTPLHLLLARQQMFLAGSDIT